MNQQRMMLVGLLCATTMVGCVTRSKYDVKQDELTRAKRQLQLVGDAAKENELLIEQLRNDKSLLEQQNSLLRSNTDDYSAQLAEMRARLEEMQAAPGIIGVDSIMEPGAFVYRVDDKFLFDPGRSALKASGKETLNQVAELLRQHDLKIEVAGHTDTDPVAKTIKEYPAGNIELGAKRAISVYDALKAAGIPVKRMHVSSYGEHNPVEPGNKARNRRVEIRVLLVEPTAQ